MRGRTRFYLAALTAAAFLFGALGTASGMERQTGMGSAGQAAAEERMETGGTGQAAAGARQDFASEGANRHEEKREFEAKARTRNAGDEFRVKVEQRLESEIREGAEDEQQAGPDKKGLEKRIAELEKKLAEKPGDPKLLWKLAVACRNAGEYDKAIAALKELEGKLPHPTAKVAVLLAQCLKAKGDPEAALAELERLLESPETVPGAVYAYRAVLKEELGRVKEAAEDMEKAVAAEPKDEDLYRKIGELYEKAGEEGVKVFVKGRKPKFDARPFIENGRTLVPIRAVAEALGLKVDYDGKAGTVTIADPASGRTVVLYLGQARAAVDGKEATLDVPARVVPPGRTIVPLRFVSESLGAEVQWFPTGQVVAVN